MHISRYRLAALTLGSLSLTAPLHAAPLTLAAGSTINATISLVGDTPAITTSTVTSLPYATPTTENVNGQISTVSPTLTTSEFSLAYSQTVAGYVEPSEALAPSLATQYNFADGNGDLYFIPGASTSYTLAGTLASTGFEDELQVSLEDTTTNTLIYTYNQRNSPALTLASGAGLLSGLLNGNDTYEFFADETTAVANEVLFAQPLAPAAALPTLTGTVSITFTPVPEPASATMLLPALAASTLTRRGRRGGIGC
jgi:hypothetical protein